MSVSVWGALAPAARLSDQFESRWGTLRPGPTWSDFRAVPIPEQAVFRLALIRPVARNTIRSITHPTRGRHPPCVTALFPPPKVIAVDVDGTLSQAGRPNEKLIAYCRRKKADGFALLLWSSRGEAHAREMAERFGVTDLFSHILSKPGFIVDDQGWTWTRYTGVVGNLDT
jgi:hypothetical protein